MFPSWLFKLPLHRDHTRGHLLLPSDRDCGGSILEREVDSCVFSVSLRHTSELFFPSTLKEHLWSSFSSSSEVSILER